MSDRADQGRRSSSLEVPTLTDRDRELLERLLGNPLEYPRALKEWVPRHVEENPPRFTMDALPDASRAISGMGTIWPHLPAPDGYVVANGQVLARKDAEGLFRLIGTSFNSGGESEGQFRVPNVPPPASGVYWILKL